MVENLRRMGWKVATLEIIREIIKDKKKRETILKEINETLDYYEDKHEDINDLVWIKGYLCGAELVLKEL